MNQGAAVWPGGVDHSGTPRVSCGRLQRIDDLVIRSIDAPYSCSACLSQLVNACVCGGGRVYVVIARGRERRRRRGQADRQGGCDRRASVAG